jgi:hypothetical protein
MIGGMMAAIGGATSLLKGWDKKGGIRGMADFIKSQQQTRVATDHTHEETNNNTQLPNPAPLPAPPPLPPKQIPNPFSPGTLAKGEQIYGDRAERQYSVGNGDPYKPLEDIDELV